MEAIGQAVWLFFWLIDKTTSEQIANGERWGVVLYGKPVSAQKIAASLFIHERTARRYLAQLEAGGYIRLTKHTQGNCIYVRKSAKWKKNVEKQGFRSSVKPLNAFDRLASFVREGE